jgi:hypothetical protein
MTQIIFSAAHTELRALGSDLHTTVHLDGPHSAPEGATWVQTVAGLLPGVEFGTSGTGYGVDPSKDLEKPQC